MKNIQCYIINLADHLVHEWYGYSKFTTEFREIMQINSAALSTGMNNLRSEQMKSKDKLHSRFISVTKKCNWHIKGRVERGGYKDIEGWKNNWRFGVWFGVKV